VFVASIESLRVSSCKPNQACRSCCLRALTCPGGIVARLAETSETFPGFRASSRRDRARTASNGRIRWRVERTSSASAWFAFILAIAASGAS
jgi:hypothetical protein